MNQAQAIRSIQGERGSALVLSLLALLILSVVGTALLGLGLSESNIATNWRDYSQTFYAAEAGLESGFVNLRTVLAGTPNPTQDVLDGISAPSLSQYGLNSTLSVGGVANAAPFAYNMRLATGPYTGLNAIVTDYQINSQATGPQGSKADLIQIIQYQQVPLFQFGIFYGKGVDLEIAPGPTMTITGRVHANSDIYVAEGSTGSLTFNSYITTPGEIYRRLKRDSASPWYGTHPEIRDSNGVLQELNFDHDHASSGSAWTPEQWRDQAMSTFGGKVQDGAMGVSEIKPLIPDLFNDPSNPDVVSHQLIDRPAAGDSAATQAAKLYSQADLRIVDGVATDKNGSPVSLPAGVVTTNKTFYDKRAGRNITVAEIDVGLLRTSLPSLLPSFNGVLYVAQTQTWSGTQGHAVRLKNGSLLPKGSQFQGRPPEQGFTVVSENPVYVQGNYNTGNSNPDTTTTDTSAKVPAAILADAITVLSKKWDDLDGNGLTYDDKGSQATSNRPAEPTTVNAAFALGPSAESDVGLGNGQVENVIRFLENWSGKEFTYSGSIVSLWHSRPETGAWQCCGNSGTNYYNPPIRTWGYDSLFDTTPPPGTPSGIIISKGRWARK